VPRLRAGALARHNVKVLDLGRILALAVALCGAVRVGAGRGMLPSCGPNPAVAPHNNLASHCQCDDDGKVRVPREDWRTSFRERHVPQSPRAVLNCTCGRQPSLDRRSDVAHRCPGRHLAAQAELTRAAQNPSYG